MTKIIDFASRRQTVWIIVDTRTNMRVGRPFVSSVAAMVAADELDGEERANWNRHKAVRAA